MNRVALEAFTLPDGTRVPKGAMVGIPTWHMQDASNFEDPDKFDGERFLRMRQIPGLETRAQFVTTSADHLGFGHGNASNALPSLPLLITDAMLQVNMHVLGVSSPAMSSRSRYAIFS